jgi:hypothetical protein
VTSAGASRRLRRRAAYVALAVLTIALGLLVHRRGEALAPSVQDILGDALWAAMMMWWVSAIAPAASLRARVASALAVCFAVEFSQLYHTPALDRLRDTGAGHLVLGSDFDPRDLAAYTIGVLAVGAVEGGAIRAAGRVNVP